MPFASTRGARSTATGRCRFAGRARLTLENRDPDSEAIIYWQINYALTEVPEDAAYFHARFRRTNPLPFKQDYLVLDGVRGQGHYVGTYIAWGVNNSGWWGEGEIKFFLDGDRVADNLRHRHRGLFLRGLQFRHRDGRSDIPARLLEFTTPYAGLPQVIRPDGDLSVAEALRPLSLAYHGSDTVRARSRVTMQAIGWRTEKDERRYLPLQDDIASVAYWYQTLPTAPFPPLPDRDYLEII